ncbi:MAG: energy transducer TonB [Porphyromonadaceae bacterium]|nr:energy transducer TonB [Porphyromonadaceae bacterium]
MANNINLTSQEWIDLIFEGKNKSYGAYRLRQSSGKRHLYAFVVVVIAVILLFIAMSLITIYQTQKKSREAMTQVTELSNIQLEKPEVPEENIQQYIAPPVELKSTIKFTPPVIKKDEEVREDQEMKTQEELTTSDVAISVADVKGTNEETGVDIATLQDHKVIVDAEPEEKIFEVVEQPASFPGGDAAMMKWLNENIRYPVLAQENGIQGRVIIQFVVARDGTIDDIKVVRGVDPSLDREAVRLVGEMPKWIPGKQGGTAVKVRFTLPIVFKLQN